MCAHELLNKDLGFLVDNVWVLSELGYHKLPKHYQEALMIYQLGHPEQKIDLENLKSDQAIVRKVIEFGQQFSVDPKPVLNNYLENYQGMYLLYWFFTKGVS